MGDLIYLAVLLAFFAVASALVRACARIVGPADVAAGVAAGATVEPSAPSSAALSEVGA